VGLTDFVKKQTPHFSGVIVLGIAAYCGPMFLTFGIECKAMARNKELVMANLWIEFAGAIGVSQAAGFNGLFLWMNQSWGRHIKEREDNLREVKEEKRKNGSTVPPVPSDPNLR
jgi:hypothetical protein